MNKNTKVYVKKNPAYYLCLDAELAFSMATESKSKSDFETEKFYSRTCILLYPLALEAIINMVYIYHEAHEEINFKKMSLKQKWIEAPRVCLPLCGVIESNGKVLYKPGDRIEIMNEHENPFLSYWELRRIRNDIVHLKPTFKFVENDKVENFINESDLYPITKIPTDYSHISLKHAEIARGIFQAMVTELNRLLLGNLRWILSSPVFKEFFTSLPHPIIKGWPT